MTNGIRTAVLGLGLVVGTSAFAQPGQQPLYQAQTMPMGQSMGQGAPMMNTPQMQAQMMQMQAQMSQMQQGCVRMMSDMGDHMRRQGASRR